MHNLPGDGGTADGTGRPLIAEFRAATKRYGDVLAADMLDFGIGRGEFLSFLGPSGCGKTTALRMLAGFETPTSGDVFLDGERVTEVPAHQRPVNMVFQHYALFPHLTVADNIAYGLMQRRPRPDRADVARKVDRALDMVRLSGFGRRRIWEMSGGQQQRVALARAIVNEPKVLLLDEPLAALDRKLRREMQIELQTLQRQLGITFVLVTHDQEEALVMSDRIAVMFEGEIAQLADPETLYRRPNSKKVAEFIGTMNFIPAQVISETGGQIEIEAKGLGRATLPADQCPAGRGDAPMVGLRPETLTLLYPGQTATDRSVDGVIDEVIYFGDMTYYDVYLGGTDVEVRLSMRNTPGRPILEVGSKVDVAWSPSALVLFR